VKQWIKNYHDTKGTFAKNPEELKKATEGVLKECEKAVDLFIEYRKKGLPDEDAKLAALDEMTVRFGLIDLSGANS